MCFLFTIVDIFAVTFSVGYSSLSSISYVFLVQILKLMIPSFFSEFAVRFSAYYSSALVLIISRVSCLNITIDDSKILDFKAVILSASLYTTFYTSSCEFMELYVVVIPQKYRNRFMDFKDLLNLFICLLDNRECLQVKPPNTVSTIYKYEVCQIIVVN